MPESATPLDELQRDLAIMAKMISLLPDGMQRPIYEQFQRLVNHLLQSMATVIGRDRMIIDLIESAKVEQSYIAFDLEATRRERDRYRQLLDDYHDD